MKPVWRHNGSERKQQDEFCSDTIKSWKGQKTVRWDDAGQVRSMFLNIKSVLYFNT